jgi:hypothetical protein
MAVEERAAYLKSLAAPVLKEFGLRTLNQIKTHERMKKEAVPEFPTTLLRPGEELHETTMLQFGF